jgi:hypothetical protein
MGIAGSIMQAYGQYEQGQAASADAHYQAQVAANNAVIAQQNATWAAAEGESQAGAVDLATRANVGAIKAAQAGNNISVNSGSAKAVQGSAATLGKLDALTTMSNAARAAYGFETQQMGFTAESELQATEASQAKEAGEIGMMSSLLSGASSAANRYRTWQQVNGNGFEAMWM